MVKTVLTSTRRRVIVALAALGVLAPAASAEAATFWTLRPDKREPLLWVGLSPEGLDSLGQPTVFPALAVPTAGALDQHWSLRKSGIGYKIVNRQSGGCLWGTPGEHGEPGSVRSWPCSGLPTSYHSWNFHRPGVSQPMRSLSSGVYQIRYSTRKNGREISGRCLAVPYSMFHAGAKLGTEPCSRGQAANQRFLVKSFSAP